MDLFEAAAERAKRYPEVPGFKGQETSLQAALDITDKAKLLRERVRAVYRDCENPDGLNADEVADILGEDILSIRPRVSELVKLGELADSHICRPSSRGKSSKCWRLKGGKPCETVAASI